MIGFLKNRIAYKKYGRTSSLSRLKVVSLFVYAIAVTASAVLVFDAVAPTEAAVTKIINFQGKLTNNNASGTNVANGSYTIEFKMYTGAAGGSPVWTETWDGSSGSCPELAVTNGVFNAKLGACASLASVDFTGGSMYISVNVEGDGEMSPRKQVGSTVYALLANGVSGDGTVNVAPGQSATALTVARSGSDYAFQVDTNTASSATGLKVTSAAAGNGLAVTVISSGTNENLTVDAKGSGTISIGASSTGDVLLAGGSGSTGCTVANSTGNFTCTGTLTGSNFSGSSSGTNTGDQTTSGTSNRITVTNGSTNPVIDIAATYVGQTSITTLGTIATGVWNGTALTDAYVSDTLTASNFVGSGSTTNAVDLATAEVAGTLAVGNGGTGATTLTGLLLGNGTSAFSAVTTSSGISGALSDETGTGGALVFASNPTLSGITMADNTNIVLNTTTGTKIGTATNQKLGFYNATPIVQPSGNALTALSNLGLVSSPTLPASSVSSGAALTKADDTNVTLTLGGTPSSALLASTSLTLGWTGQLSVARGGTGAATLTTNGVLYGNGTSAIGATAAGTTGECLVATTGSAPSWGSCSTGGVAWSALTAPSGNLSLAHGANTTAFTFNSLTTGTAFDLSSTSLSSGAILNLASNGTAALTNQTGLNISLQGTNGTGGQTTYGAQISNAHAGTTSTNVALQLSATNGTSANYALIVPVSSGNVGIGNSAPAGLFSVGSTSQFQVNSSGTIAAATGISSSGTIAFSGLSTNGPVYTTGGTGTLASEANLSVVRGGSGAGTLTGILLGNGTSAFTGITASSGISGALSDETGTGGALVFASNPTLSGATFADATNIVLNTTTGTKIGTATNQKLGFFNATPVVQQTGNISTALSNLGLVTSGTLPTSSVTGGAALTKSDDTNVTLTLGGTPSTALLQATSLTLGWSGQLSVARGGTGAATLTTNGVLYGNGTSAVQATAQGGANTVLVANAGAPSFSAAITVGTSVTSPTINASTVLQLGSTDINTAGTLTNVAYENQANVFTAAQNITVQSATALTVARTGSNYALQVDTNTASSATGLKVTAAAAGGGLALTTISSGTDENLTIDAKGAGTISIGASSTGDVLLAGGSGSTGCTVTNSNGNFACTGTGTFSNISGTNTGDQTTSGTSNRITVTNGSTNPVIDIASTYVGQTSITTLGTIATGVWNGTALTDAYVSDTLTSSIFIGSGSTTNAIDLATAEVAGTLPVGNGGSGAATLTGLLLGNGTSAFTGVTTSAGISGAISDETGTGGALVFASNPTLSGITMADNTNIVLNTTTGTKIGTATNQKLGFFNATPVVQQSGNISTALSNLGLVTSGTLPTSSVTGGAALTKSDDTNVTLTLGGSPSTALLSASSVTVGWTGQLAVSRGGSGASTLTGILLGNGTSAFTGLTTSAGIAGALSDETGTGLLVFNNSPSFVDDIAIGANGGATGQILLRGSSSGTITVQSQAAAGTYNFNLPTTAGTSGYVLTSAGGGGSAMTWTDPSTFGGSSSWSALTNPSGALTLDHGANITAFTFNSVTNSTAFHMSSTSLQKGTLLSLLVDSTGASNNDQKALRVATQGANTNSTETTYGGYFSNTHTGTDSTNVGLYSLATGGTNNYAGIFLGMVGIGTLAPGYDLDVQGTFFARSGPGVQIEANSTVVLGDASNTSNGVKIVVDDPNQYIDFNSAYAAGEFGGYIDKSNRYLTWGDQGAGLATRISIDDLNETIFIDSGNGYAYLGDAQVVGNGTQIAVDDVFQTLDFNRFVASSSFGGMINSATGVVAWGDGGAGNGTWMGVNDGSQLISLYSNSVLVSSLAGVGTRCVNVDSSGVLGATTCGGALTPWTSDIDADGYDLQDLSNIEFRETTGAPAGSVVAIFRDNSGDMTANVLSGKTFNLAVNGTDEYNFSATALAMNSNNITGVGSTLSAAAGMTISSTSANLALATTTSGNITMAPASTGSVQITSGVTSGTTTSSGLSLVANSLSTGVGFNASTTSLTSGSLVNLSVSSTAAVSNTQKVLNVTTSGANGTSTQTTYGGYFSNTHTGTSSTNVAAYFTASGGTNNYAAIFDAGNVGIGTTTPLINLHVATQGATSGFGTTPAGRGIAITGANGNVRQYFESTNATSGQRVFMMDNTSGLLSFNSLSNDASSFVTQNIMNMTYDGKVGIGVSTPTTGKLHVVGSTTASGATAVAGIFTDLTLTNSTGSGFQYGNRSIITVNGGTAGTEVGQFIRMIDNTSLNAGQTVRGLEVQAFSGTNVNGINTGIASYGYTFGIQGTTTAQAASQAAPAAIFADLDNGTDATTKTRGNAIRAYTNDATSADLVYFFQEASAYTGNGLLMDFGNGGGSFSSGNFINLKNAGTSKLTVSNTGRLDLFAADADNSTPLYINSEESTASQMLFAIESDTTNNGQSADAVKAHFRADGSLYISLTGTQTTNALCHTGSGQANNDQIVDCSGAPSDIAEYFGTDDPTLTAGEVVVVGRAAQQTHIDGYHTSKAWVARSTKPYQETLMGVVSTAPAVAYGDEIFSASENPRPIALSGRVPVKVTTENGPIKPGDFLTASSTPGAAMKATKAGPVIGQALENYNGGPGSVGSVIVFVKAATYNGAAIQNELPGLAFDYADLEQAAQTSYDILAHLMEQLPSLDPDNLSQVRTDIVIAGGEVVTPAVTANMVRADFLSSATADGALSVASSTVFNGGLLVDSIGSIGTLLAIESDVEFFGIPYFTTDTAGFAVIKPGAQSVDVVFTRQYLSQPIVSANISFESDINFDLISDPGSVAALKNAAISSTQNFLQSGVSYAVTNKTASGFTIVLNKPAPEAIKFSWIALAVKNANTFMSVGGAGNDEPEQGNVAGDSIGSGNNEESGEDGESADSGENLPPTSDGGDNGEDNISS